MISLLRCQSCGNEFEAKRNDAKWCPSCRQRGIHEGSSFVCPLCGGDKKHPDSVHCQSCENKLRARKGSKSWNWKGGKSHSRSGHVLILKPEGYGENYKHRYVLEHRVIWEQLHGKLPDGYLIHHLNGVPNDNRPENLAALPANAHSGSAVLRVFKNRIRQLEAQVKEFRSTSQQIFPA